MADVFAYLYGFGAGGDFTKSVIIVTAPTGSTVTCTKGTVTKTAAERNGEWWFKGLEIGTWTLKATLSGQTATQTVNITQFGVYRIAMVYRVTPEFTYTGNYKVVQDNDSQISDFANWKGNWKIRFLTSGTFTVKNMYGWDGKIDAFLLGAGASGSSRPSSTGAYGAGGGSGRTKTIKKIKLTANEPYPIEIGSGGAPVEGDPALGKQGGSTNAFGETAKGGDNLTSAGSHTVGGNGGSGGAGRGGEPGADGSDGTGTDPGKGQGTTTKEFGEPDGKLYANGGRYGQSSPAAAVPNSGNGGDGGKGGLSGAGSSGIVVIRNAREVA